MRREKKGRPLASELPRISVSLPELVSMTPDGAATVTLAASVAPGCAGLTQPLKVSVALSLPARSRPVQLGEIEVALKMPSPGVKTAPSRLKAPVMCTRSRRDGPVFDTTI
jgi:hypothetical protein